MLWDSKTNPKLRQAATGGLKRSSDDRRTSVNNSVTIMDFWQFSAVSPLIIQTMRPYFALVKVSC